MEVLDAHSGDTEVFSCLFDGFELSDDVLQAVGDPGLGTHLTILDRVHVPAPWRGRRLGPLLAACALLALGASAQVFACYPSAYELPVGSAEREKETERLERIWGRLGFEHFRNGVWTLSPAYTSLEQARASLLEDLGAE